MCGDSSVGGSGSHHRVGTDAVPRLEGPRAQHRTVPTGTGHGHGQGWAQPCVRKPEPIPMPFLAFKDIGCPHAGGVCANKTPRSS